MFTESFFRELFKEDEMDERLDPFEDDESLRPLRFDDERRE